MASSAQKIIKAIGISKSYIAEQDSARVTFEFDTKRDFINIMNVIEEAEIEVESQQTSSKGKKGG